MSKTWSIITTVAVAGSLLAAPNAVAQPAAPAAGECVTTTQLKEGTISWGIKQSWRTYVKGRIARGSWNLAGNVTEGAGDSGAADFGFVFPVDTTKTKVSVGDNGIDIQQVIAQDSTITFEGHHGALYSQFGTPVVSFDGGEVRAGGKYLGYFNPAKAMTEYTAEDRTEEFKIAGDAGFFGKSAPGSAPVTWQWSQDKKTATVTAPLVYQADPGTSYNSDTREQKVAGPDVVFLGNYQTGDKIDPVTVTLTFDTTTTCPTPEAPVPPTPGTSTPTTPAPGTSTPSTSAAAPSTSATQSSTSATQSSTSTTQSSTSAQPADPKPQAPWFQRISAWILPLLAALGGLLLWAFNSGLFRR